MSKIDRVKQKVEDLYQKYKVLVTSVLKTSERLSKHFGIIEQHDKKLQEIAKKLSDYHNNKEFQEELKELKSKTKENYQKFENFQNKIYTKIDALVENTKLLKKEINANNVGKVSNTISELKKEYEINMQSINSRIRSLEESAKMPKRSKTKDYLKH